MPLLGKDHSKTPDSELENVVRVFFSDLPLYPRKVTKTKTVFGNREMVACEASPGGEVGGLGGAECAEGRGRAYHRPPPTNEISDLVRTKNSHRLRATRCQTTLELNNPCGDYLLENGGRR